MAKLGDKIERVRSPSGKRGSGMSVKAPFHIWADFQRDWLLFSYRAEFNQLDRVQWDYWQTQKLATQAEQLQLRSKFEKWRSRRKFCRTGERGAHKGE